MLRQIARQFVRNVLDNNLLTTRSIATTSTMLKDEGQAAAPAAASPPPEQKFVVVEKEKNITLIGIDRPQQRNAMNAKAAAQLCEAIAHFEADQTSPVAVLYGVGGSFCSGYDILELSSGEEEQVSLDILMSPEGSVGPTRRHLKKPVVCGINGYCIANGLELALMCDLRVMEESATLGFFNRRFGVPVIDGGTVRLPAMIGYSRALDLILTGRQVNACEAYEMGIANRIVPTGEALCRALELAKTLAKFPQGALNHDRNSLYSAVFESANFGQSIQNEIMYTSREIIDEMQEGIKWFNKTFKSGETKSWLKRDRSMADWDDEEVASAAAVKEQEKQAIEAARIEAEKKKKAEEATAAEAKKKVKAEAKTKAKSDAAAEAKVKADAAAAAKTKTEEPTKSGEDKDKSKDPSKR